MTAQPEHLVEIEDDVQVLNICTDPYDEGCSLEGGSSYDGCCPSCADRLSGIGRWA